MGFSDDIKKFTVKCSSNSDAVVRKTVLEITSMIDEMSPVGNPEGGGVGGVPPWKSKPPVGYVGGHFRANWQLGVNVQPTGEIPGHEYKGVLEKEQAKIPAKAGGHVYYYQNNVPYAQVLEDGRTDSSGSFQAPHGMVGITTLHFGGIVEKAAAEVNK